MRLPRIGFDTETHKGTQGRPAPRLVCLSAAWGDDALPEAAAAGLNAAACRGIDWALLPRAEAARAGAALLNLAADGAVELVAHNAAYDVAVVAQAAHEVGIAGVFADAVKAYERGTIRCTYLRERLIAVAHDATLGQPKGRFGLAVCVAHYFGEDRQEQKGDYSPCTGAGCAPLTPWADCPDCLGFGWTGPWRWRYHQLDGIPLDQWPKPARDYAIQDAIDTLRLCGVQDHAPDTPIGPVVVDGIVVDEVPQVRGAFGLDLFAANGVCVDAPDVAALAERVTALAAHGHQLGIDAGFIRGPDGAAVADPVGTKRGRPGSQSTKALHALVAAAYGGNPPRNDPTAKARADAKAAGIPDHEVQGSVTASRDVLLASGDAALIAYAETGVARKLAEVYVPILQRGVAMGPIAGVGSPHGPITCRYDSLKRSGRTGARDPNWQNPPRDGAFRSCVVPRPGFLLIAADYGAIEMRALAQICEWEGFGSTMADSFRQGRDPHLEFAAHWTNLDYAEAVKLYAAGDPLVSERRQFAKVANYGFPGGLGPESFVRHARKQGVPLAEDEQEAIDLAWELKTAWRRAWPELDGYFDLAGRLTAGPAGRGTIRQYVSGRIRGGVGFCTACNNWFQGLVADGAKAAVWAVARDSKGFGPKGQESPLFGTSPNLFLHDEIIIEAPADRVTEAAAELQRVMVEEMARFIPDLPIEAEAAAMERWYKGPKPKHDPAGRLVPWEPAPKATAEAA